MNDISLNPLEAILRLCAAAAPEPWYPRVYAKNSGEDLDRLGDCLEDLWLDGLVERARGRTETGPGFVLTDAGRRVLEDPEDLQRLRDGLPLATQDRAAVVRQALRRPPRPVLTRVLLVANLLVFGYGVYRVLVTAPPADRLHMVQEFLQGFGVQDPRVLNILHDSGAVKGADVIHGEWWRLLTMAFVHIGVLHLLMNMYMLWAAGSFVEAMWGRVRYLVIYGFGVLGGSCLAVAHTPLTLIAGASGALCGLLAAEAVWVLLNARYLPRALARRGRASIVTTFLLLVFISLFPGVSGWCHFGGAVAGGAAALLLHVQRFGPSPWRWLAVAALVPLPWLGFRAIERQRVTDKRWHELERQAFVEGYRRQYFDTLRGANQVYKDKAEPLLEMHPTRRDAGAVAKVLPELAHQRQELEALAARLNRAGPYRDPDTEQLRQQDQRAVGDFLQKVSRAEQCLRENGDWADGIEEAQFVHRYLRPIQAVTKAADATYRERVRPLLRSRPGRRDGAEVDKVLPVLAEQQRELSYLAKRLDHSGPYPDEDAEGARQAARDYLAGSARLLELAEHCLRAGDRRTVKEEKDLQQQADRVDELRQVWRECLN
jgi:membrane associated rhomboid family serine protease